MGRGSGEGDACNSTAHKGSTPSGHVLCGARPEASGGVAVVARPRAASVATAASQGHEHPPRVLPTPGVSPPPRLPPPPRL
eukprot:124744-Chlamydomonas_euryale.AAC.1